MNLVLTLLLKCLIVTALFASETCDWCVFGQAKITNDVVRIANLSPGEALSEVRRHSICVKVMRTNRKVPPGTFAWQDIQPATIEMNQVTRLAGVMGKTLCPGELPITGKCATIILASDAPFSTLIHEYLHYIEIQRDPTWCAFSKTMWVLGSSDKDLKKLSDKEWDVHLFLWNNYKKMKLDLDDKIAFISELVSTAEQRKNVDPDAKKFLEIENPAKTLNELIAEYKKTRGINR